MKLSRRERKKLKGKPIKEEAVKQERAPEHDNHEKKQCFIKRIYEKEYRKLLLIPLIILLLAVVQIVVQVSTTGDFINKDVSLKGGITIIISAERDWDNIEFGNFLSNKYPENDINVRLLSEFGRKTGIAIEADIQPEDEEKITSFIFDIEEKTSIGRGEFSIESIGSSLGASFFRETLRAVLVAFVFMGIVVFLYFKVPAPSLAVILSAFSDIIVTMAVVNLLGIKLSTAGIAAFLMLIGYSVDTDILLSTSVLKGEGSVISRVYSAMGTGFAMSLTTLVAVTVALLFAKSVVLKQIMIIILIGLVVDLVMTWIQNAGLLRIYMEKSGKKRLSVGRNSSEEAE